MGILDLFILAVGLSMDAFAVSICKGLSLGKIKIRHMLTAGIWFGGFQALMPLIGYFLGNLFAAKIDQYDHWIAFVLLLILGINMIRESRQEEESTDQRMNPKTMAVLAVATSIDALAVGVTFSFFQIQIIPTVIFIGATTFFISFIGVKIGSIFGVKFNDKAQLIGGLILILIGGKILLEGLSIL
ncbi:MAG: manganese efflux pump MntP family protein [Eubacterium sp.]|nr:manganese efflux pump MntP family protein [Eubacterium sp.]